MGCTTYFASPRDGVAGLAESMLTNLTGVFWAMVIIKLSTIMNVEVIGYMIMAADPAFFVGGSCVWIRHESIRTLAACKAEPVQRTYKRFRKDCLGFLT
ncbi:DUF1097 domain-containing protein [Parendozoicomonas callyspongiae]|uniref:DUF1097 domain-containing protein n=1 Tax=Parendozoicomonas callyspongiae TaxID=2942213 RepID=UPI0038CD0E7C